MKINIKLLRKIILILAVIILIGIGMMLMLLNDPVENRINYIYSDKEGTIPQMPLNVSPLFMEYSGRLDERTIYKAMSVFVNDIVQDYYSKFKGDFAQEKIEKYFESNKKDIEKELGINDKKVFVEFINTLKNLKGDTLKLKQYIIIPESIIQVVGATKLVLAVDYEGNDRVLFELRISNTSPDDRTPINYKATTEDYLSYELPSSDISNDIEPISTPGKVIK